MEDKTTSVNYSVIDSCIQNINQGINDYYISIELGRLLQIFSVSTGRTKEELMSAALELRETYQIIQDMMFAAKDMLTIAKNSFQNADLQTAEEIGGDI